MRVRRAAREVAGSGVVSSNQVNVEQVHFERARFEFIFKINPLPPPSPSLVFEGFTKVVAQRGQKKETKKLRIVLRPDSNRTAAPPSSSLGTHLDM